MAVIDVKKAMFGNKWHVYTHNGKQKHKVDLLEHISQLQENGIGEIVINSIDCDGVQKGYDMGLVDYIKSHVTVPLTVLGGAGHLDDIKELFTKHGIVGAAAGSLFVFKGKFRAVLISYPDQDAKFSLYS